MVKVSYNKEKIVISGHANYKDYGNDIVCASVSSIIYTTINGILNINKNAITYEDTKDLVINIISDDDITKKLIENMITLLKDLAEQYPKNINVKEN